MKKRFLPLLTSLLLSASLFAQTEEYKLQLNERIYVGTSRAFECVATLAYLSGFQEYSQISNQDYANNLNNYFNQYRSDDKLQAALSTFEKGRNFGLSYDAVASLGTYLSSDCHSFRAPIEIVKKNIDQRIKNPEEYLKVISEFYDAVDFNSFYQSNKALYERACAQLIQNKENLITAISSLESYYKKEIPELWISASFLNGSGNYGVSFNDGKNVFFEPKYCAGYYDANLIVHELSHPFSNPLAYKIAKNKAIMKLVKKDFTGDKKRIMEQMAYNNEETYIIELLNRANTIRITSAFCDEYYINTSIFYDQRNRFDEIKELSELLKKYQNGNYSCIEDFYPELEKGLLQILKAKSSKKKDKSSFSAEDTKEFSLFGQAYKASYCGYSDLNGFKNFSGRKFWRLENAYEAIKNLPVTEYLPYDNFPFSVNTGDVFVAEYLLNDGRVFKTYYRADGANVNGSPVCYGFFSEFK